MKRENILIGVVIVLAIINGLVLYRFVSGPGGPPDGPPPHDKIIVERLGLDQSQQRAFDGLKYQHRTKVNELESHFEKTMEAYFLLLRSNDQSKKDSLESVLGGLEREKAMVTYEHFKDLKDILRPDQKEKFDAFIPELFRFIMPPHPKRKLPPPGRNH